MLAFLVHDTVTTPGPVPDVGEAVMSLLPLFAFQLSPVQPAGEPEMVTVADPACAPVLTTVGSMEKLVETALLEDTDGTDVVPGHVREERPLTQKFDELTESARRNTFPPVLATDPVTDQSLLVLDPAANAPGNLVATQDGPIDAAFIGPDLRPMLQVGSFVASWKRGHLDGDGISLVVVEDLDIRAADFAQGD